VGDLDGTETLRCKVIHLIVNALVVHTTQEEQVVLMVKVVWRSLDSTRSPGSTSYHVTFLSRHGSWIEVGWIRRQETATQRTPIAGSAPEKLPCTVGYRHRQKVG